MKLSEARTTARRRVYWIRDLKWNDVLEHTYVPFIEPITKVVIIAADGEYEGSHHNLHTIPYDDVKHVIPWAIEVIASNAQLRQLLDLYWPEVGGDQIVQSTVWDDASLERVIDAAQDKIPAKELHNLGEQVTRILEAKYHRQPSVDEVYDKYVSLANSDQKQYGPIVVVDVQWWDDSEYDDWEGGPCTAALMLWVIDSSIEDAEKEIPRFMSAVNLPFSNFDVDPGILPAGSHFKHNRLHATVRYEGKCPLNEARTLAGPSAKRSIDRHQVYNLYKQHESSTGTKADPNIQVRQNVVRTFSTKEDIIVPSIHFWFQSNSKYLNGAEWPESKEKATKFAEDFMRRNNLPYTSSRTATKFGASLLHVQFRFGETEDLKHSIVHEARHIGDDFTNELRLAIEGVKRGSAGNDITQTSFDVDTDYYQTQEKLEKILGPALWETYDYGDDVPYWLIDDAVYITIEKQARGKHTKKFVTEVIVEHHPKGFGNH